MIFLRYEEKKGYCFFKILFINSRIKLFFFLLYICISNIKY